MTNNAEVVEDIGQDVFVAAFKSLKDFQAKSSFFTWLYRIAVNQCKNYLVASSRFQNMEARYRSQQKAEVKDAREDDEKNPQNMLLAKEFAERLDGAIAKLPEEQRVALILCEFQGLSYQEMSEILDCPVGTVRSRLARARIALQAVLEDAGGEA